MAIKHNKKRNSGMLSEFFAMYIADSVVSRKYDRVTAAKKLWSKHVNSGSELRKEMRLFEAVQGKRFESKQVAYDLLIKVKHAAKKLQREKLEREKTTLIREVNQRFGAEFFNKPVSAYQELASVQVLMNYCSSNTFREGVINPAVAEIEDRILTFMTDHNPDQNDLKRNLNEILSKTEREVDGLVVNIMREKMNKKFSPRLTEGQKTILQQYVFDSDSAQLKETLGMLREETLHLITEELAQKPTKTERDKLTEIDGLLREDYRDVSKLDETTITFYMTVSKLNDELKDD